MASITINFDGSIVLPTESEQTAFNRMIGWSAQVEVAGSTETVDNPVSQSDAFYTWMNELIAIRLKRTKQDIAREEASTGATISIAAPSA